MVTSKKVLEKADDEESHQQQLLVQLMDRYGRQLTNFAYTYVQDWGKAEDVVQEVFLSLYQHIGSFRGDSSYKTWLYTMIRNRSIDYLRSWSFKHLKLGLKANFKSEEPTPEEKLIRRNEKEELSRKVLALPVKYREVVILFYYESMLVREISDLLEMKESTVKTRLNRGRNLLRESYERGE